MTPDDPKQSSHAEAPSDDMKDRACLWLVRRDRGLSPDEATEFVRWLEADPRHQAAWADTDRIWNGIDGLRPPLAETRRIRPGTHRALWAAVAAVAAALAFAAAFWRPGNRDQTAIPAERSPRVFDLSDGTRVFLKSGSELTERFDASERRVLLLRGEAQFEVAKNPDWPFVVRAGGVEVRAVGTAFNVVIQPFAVEVRVTEGRVRIAPETASSGTPAGVEDAEPLVVAGQRAVVELTPGSAPGVRISAMNTSELLQVVSWQEPLMQLHGKTLGELATEFEQRTGRPFVLADPELRDLRIGGQYPVDDPDGFVWIMELNGLRSEKTPEGGIILHKSR